MLSRRDVDKLEIESLDTVQCRDSDTQVDDRAGVEAEMKAENSST